MFDNFYLNVKLLHDEALMPTRATDGDAGLDVRCPHDICIYPNSDLLVDLGIQMEFPKGYVAIVKEKSGNAVKKHISIGACVIDAGYRGNIKIHLINNASKMNAIFNASDSIAQIVIVPAWTGKPIQVEEFIKEETERGSGGFGSTKKRG